MSPLHWIIGIMSNAAFSLLLMGLIIGFGVGKWHIGGSVPALASTPSAPVIQAPPSPAPLRPPGCGL